MTSIATPHQIWLPVGASTSFLNYAVSFSSPYTLDSSSSKPQSWRGIYIRVGILQLWYLFVFCPLVEVWDYHSQASPSDEEWAVGWMQPDLFPCANVSLVIGIGQGYWLDDKGSPSECYQLNDEGALSECHRLDDKGLIPASHYYARVVARWLKVLASYAGRPNLTVITSGMVLERLKAR